ncbi:MAG: hypothetical protein U0793_13500 [Gemmataceae bacterium]
MAIEHQPPEVLALVLADYVHRDDNAGKFFIMGTRASIGATSFPFNCPSLGVYVSMIDGRDETLLRLRLVDVDEAREPVLDFETTVRFLDPLEELEAAFRLVDLVFPEPGDYRLQLFAAGQFLRERRFLVIPLENPGS